MSDRDDSAARLKGLFNITVTPFTPARRRSPGFGSPVSSMPSSLDADDRRGAFPTTAPS